jgi:hypothetical protein
MRRYCDEQVSRNSHRERAYCTMWKFIRITLLSLVLFVVAGAAWMDKLRTTSWKETVRVGIFPMNGDGSAVADRYVQSLTDADFASIEAFFTAEAHRYGVALDRPISIALYPARAERPPTIDPGSGAITAMWWSLKMRMYARRAAKVPGHASSHIRVFVLFHDPAVSESLPHSLGLQKGLVGVVHAFADRSMRGENAIVIAHETMHTVGATDKYHLDTGQPIYPEGYAEPDRSPRFPQDQAEIMAGTLPISATGHVMPEGLGEEVVGHKTAVEIGWIAQ